MKRINLNLLFEQKILEVDRARLERNEKGRQDAIDRAEGDATCIRNMFIKCIEDCIERTKKTKLPMPKSYSCIISVIYGYPEFKCESTEYTQALYVPVSEDFQQIHASYVCNALVNSTEGLIVEVLCERGKIGENFDLSKCVFMKHEKINILLTVKLQNDAQSN